MSNIYFIGSSGPADPIKIGVSSNVQKRLKCLQTGSGFTLQILATKPGTIEDEKKLHEQFSHCRISGEWFSRSPDLLALISSLNETRCFRTMLTIQEAAKSLGVPPTTVRAWIRNGSLTRVSSSRFCLRQSDVNRAILSVNSKGVPA